MIAADNQPYKPFALGGTAGVTSPTTNQLTAIPAGERGTPTKLPQATDTPAWDGQYWDQSKLDAALKEQGPGADGRTVANNDTWMKALNPLSGLTMTEKPVAASMGYWDPVSGSPATGEYASDAGLTMGGERLGGYGDALGRAYKVVGKDANGNTLIQYNETNGVGWEDPTGSGRDRLAPTYRLDASGNAVPVSSGSTYNPSGWVDHGRDVAKGVAAMAAAYFGGTALAGMDAAGAGAAGAGTTAGGGVGGSVAGSSAAGGSSIGTAVGEAAGSAAAGSGAATGATNAALAESAIGTAGYGASSAGVGGGAGTLATTGSLAAGAEPFVNAAVGAGGTTAATGAGTSAATQAGSNAAASQLVPGVSNGQLLTLGTTAALQAANKPPSAPDAGQLAQTQTDANIKAAETSASINRPDINTPFGSQTWSRVADPSQPGGFRYIQNNTLSAGEQQLYDADTANKIAKQGIASGLQGAAADAVKTPFSLSGQPALQTSVANGDKYASERDKVADAVYQQGLRQLKPGMDQATEAQDSQLRNQGLMPGTQAYDTALENLRRSQSNQLNDLTDRATQAGGAEQSRLAGLDLTSANFANNARQQSIQEALLQRTQPLAELNSFTSGAAPTTPTFQPFGTSSVAPTNTIGAAQFQAQGEQNAYNARQAQLQSLLNLGTSMYASNQPQYDPNTGTWVTKP